MKGRFILDAIILLWEGIEHVEKSHQVFLFIKIYFDKAYDKLEWDFLMHSLMSMGGLSYAPLFRDTDREC